MNLVGKFHIGERITVLLAGLSVVLFLGVCLLRWMPDENRAVAPKDTISAPASARTENF